MSNILLDLNNVIFQKKLFSIEKHEQRALLNTLSKIRNLSWSDLYQDKGVRWELIISEKTVRGDNLYSLRFSKKYRGTAYREKDYLVLVGIFTDHDGAYQA